MDMVTIVSNILTDVLISTQQSSQGSSRKKEYHA
jgi:hypothetical protein